MADFDVDLAVIGGGSGGVRAARIAAGYGARVVMAEEYRFGGTCVIRGCVPKKLLVYASRFTDEFEDAAGYGWTVEKPTFDWPSLVRAKEAEITRLEGIYAANAEKAGVRPVRSRARLTGPQEVLIEATGERLTARTILVATGGATVREPHVPGIEHTITSNEAFDLPEQPKRILIVGGGYIAVEFAGIFHGLGSHVVLAHRGPHLLRGFDADIRSGLDAAYRARGIDLRLGVNIVEIEKKAGSYCVHFDDGSSLMTDAVMIATGRRPNVKGFGLEELNVALTGTGGIAVDAYSRTNVPSIYAVGDVTGRVALTPIAIREGHAFADTVFGGKPWTVAHDLIPTAVFSTPEIGVVGLSETQAKECGHDVSIFMATFRPLKATLSGRQERMIMKIVVDKPTDRVLGVHILGDHAGELIQLAGISVQMGATKSDFDRTVAVHPTMAEELVTMRAPVR